MSIFIILLSSCIPRQRLLHGMTGPGVKPHGLCLLPFMQWAVRILYDSWFNHTFSH
ncbi:MAG TPA: hypothetical protein VGX03_21450 [Candidatus Binatia bacterium]|nr:hypothetical protein [Candidatus Binatia bacterium]